MGASGDGFWDSTIWLIQLVIAPAERLKVVFGLPTKWRPKPVSLLVIKDQDHQG